MAVNGVFGEEAMVFSNLLPQTHLTYQFVAGGNSA